MEIEFNKHSFNITPALRSYTAQKLDRISRHFDHIIRVIISFDKEKLDNVAEATIHVANNDLHARSISKIDMYSAIDMLIDKLNRQIIKHKEKIKNHRIEQ